jgi:glyoxylase-like metal-dependent hydrolase (beta-lactamase superfamily II)
VSRSDRVDVAGGTLISLDDARGSYEVQEIFPHLDVATRAALVEQFPTLHPDPHRWTPPLRGFVFHKAEVTILVDAGIGPRYVQGQEATLPAKLRNAGIDPAAVDLVVITHIHLDHIGWSLVGGLPYFANATYYFPQADWNVLARDEPEWFHEHLQPLLDAKRTRLVDGDHEVAAGARVEPRPGHTGGHQVLWLGEEAVVAGDAFLHPLQLRDPQLFSAADEDHELAAASRESLASLANERKAVVAQTHFPGAGLGRIHKQNTSFDWKPL